MSTSRRKRAPSVLETIENDRGHHLTGPFMPPTPLEPLSRSGTPSTTPAFAAQITRTKQKLPHQQPELGMFRWIARPSSSFKILVIPIILYVAWNTVQGITGSSSPNPFRPLLFISHKIPDSPDSAPLYRKGYLDLVFVAYYVIVFSFVRQFFTLKICYPVARHFGIKESKLDRFAEQGYAIFYFMISGSWGMRIMSQLPTWWYRTEQFWIGYPEWQLIPELKAFYLLQGAYWLQQLLVMLFALEKPRKDYKELIAHHLVTLWLIFWSYLVNMTYMGNAVYMSMDIPDVLLGASKLFNYLDWELPKTATFATLLVAWSYFRIWLNVIMIKSVYTEFDLVPEYTKFWNPPEGVWLTWWMRYQMLLPLSLLLALNVFWYYLILRIAYRAVFAPKDQFTDDRSDDEDDGDGDDETPMDKKKQ